MYKLKIDLKSVRIKAAAYTKKNGYFEYAAERITGQKCH